MDFAVTSTGTLPPVTRTPVTFDCGGNDDEDDHDFFVWGVVVVAVLILLPVSFLRGVCSLGRTMSVGRTLSLGRTLSTFVFPSLVVTVIVPVVVLSTANVFADTAGVVGFCFVIFGEFTLPPRNCCCCCCCLSFPLDIAMLAILSSAFVRLVSPPCKILSRFGNRPGSTHDAKSR